MRKKFISLVFITIFVITSVSSFALPQEFINLEERAKRFESNVVLRHTGNLNWDIDSVGDASPELSEYNQLGIFTDEVATSNGLDISSYKIDYFYNMDSHTITVLVTDSDDNFSYVIWKNDNSISDYFFSKEG